MASEDEKGVRDSGENLHLAWPRIARRLPIITCPAWNMDGRFFAPSALMCNYFGTLKFWRDSDEEREGKEWREGEKEGEVVESFTSGYAGPFNKSQSCQNLKIKRIKTVRVCVCL
ncbi:hypothetical protein E2C01_054851 [Portunus trituberculatus]|uniref:Uncharacterized protein n=1 Tax=Portunus trituberculatus TaxID=210409 RepID=A0A5B7GW39_PORTR|nr:hypothetical protein [Portunus trituberculatus]